MRQLLVSPETPVAVSYTNGLLANGAIDVQKKDANGEITSLAPGDTIADAPEIRFVQGTAAENIVSPWIAGRNVMVWDGKSYLAQTAKKIRVTVANAATSTGTVDIKFIRREEQPQEFFILSTSVTSGNSNTDICTAITAAATAAKNNNNWPEWLSTTVTNNGGSVDFSGSINGNTTNSGATWKESAVEFVTAIDSSEITGTTFTESVNVALVKGSGDGYDVQKMEESLMGSGYGYYNRMHFPKAPTTTAASAGDYDLYTIVATKDGSTSPQIKGVDNLMEIYIAIDEATATVTSAFEGKLNPYMYSAGYGQVNL
mgnify:FL=1